MITDVHTVKMNIHLIHNFAFTSNLKNASVLCSSSNMNYVKYVADIDLSLIVLIQINHEAKFTLHLKSQKIT